MRRWLAASSLLLSLAAAPGAHADPAASRSAGEAPSKRPVMIVAPGAQTCVQSDALLVGIDYAGPFLASLAPASITSANAPGALFSLEGTPERLQVRAWGLSARRGGESAQPELEQVITGQSCDTVTEAAVALIVTLLAPEPPDFAAGERLLVVDPQIPESLPSAIELLLNDARQALAKRPHLTAGVFTTALGLELVVQDTEARCQRATWLTLTPGKPELGMSVPQLGDAVDACRASQPPHAAADSSGADRSRFGFPMLTGVLFGLGALANAALLVNVTHDQKSALVYGAAAPVLGGVGSYLVGRDYREPVLLFGYWSGVAGTSIVVAAKNAAPKTVLVGGALAAGSLTSAVMAGANAFVRDPSARVPAWGVALPAAVGAGLAGSALFIGGREQATAPLAAIGGLAACLPGLWLLTGLGGSGTPQVDASVSTREARLSLWGTF